ncbi:serine hydrolase domain-containing protein [Streptomyces sp. Iso 434]|uniref:serine hydrolase domain-containing protein n=1 Tax=Streptomyces sp. Iso 434 TaxID=3062272 RepID=UPI00397F6D7C
MDDAELTALLAGLMARHRVPGAQLVVRRGGSVARAAVGETAVGGGRRVAPETVFPLSSLTKPFTAALAVTLAVEGDIDLDAPLAEQLPHAPDAPGITPRRLLSHTAGLAANPAEDDPHLDSLERWTARSARRFPLVAEPGSAFSYSNIGYLLTGRLVEQATGMSWSEAMGAMLLRPLGLPTEIGGPPGVLGHVVRRADGQAVLAEHQPGPPAEAPAGDLALSAEGLAAFAGLFLHDSRPGPLDPETVAAMCRDPLGPDAAGPYGMADGWGLGWARYDGDGPESFGHDGTGDGTSCHLRFDPAGGTVVALTTNADSGQELWAELVAVLRAGGVKVADHPVTGSAGLGPAAPAPDACLGRYVNGDLDYTVGRDADGLWLGVGPHGRYAVECDAGLRFALRPRSGGPLVHRGRFLRAPGAPAADGPIRHLQVSGRVARLHNL